MLFYGRESLTVTLLEGLNEEIPITVRERESSSAKDVIGALSARFIEDNDTIIIDSSTTSSHIIDYIKNRRNLTIITNGVKTAFSLSNLPHVTVYCTGGRQRSNSLSLIGDDAKRFIENYSVQKLFFSCRALSLCEGAVDASEDEANLRKTMIEKAEQVFLLIDSNKFDKRAFCRICNIRQIDCIITERQPSLQWMSEFEANGVKAVFPDSARE